MTSLDHSFHPGAAPTDSERPPALLLHPWFGCHQMWRPLTEHLDAPSYAVDWYSLADGLDAEGWASSASPHGLARAAMSLLDELGLDQVDIIGNSVGGIVSQIIAAEHPERVRRLVLIGTGASLGGPPTAFGALVGRWIDRPHERNELAGRLVDALVAVPFSPADRREYVGAVRAADAEFIAAVLTVARRTDLRPLLASITARTLVMRGEHDAARTPEHVAELISSIPDARGVKLAGLGHSPMVEDPELTASLIGDHLSAR